MDKEQQNSDKETEKQNSDKETKQQNNVKKRRGGCITTCLVLLISIFALSCILICVGFIVGDQFARQRLGMTLGETFGVVRGVTHSNGDIVDNAYDESDEAKFYDSVGETLMLNSGVIDGDKMKSTVINAINNEENVVASLGNYAADILSAQNFDQNKINGIGSTYDEAYNLKISDRELAAFLNGIVGEFLQKSLKLDSSDWGDVLDSEKLDLTDFFKLEQIKLYEENGVDMLNGIVSLGIDDILNEVKGAINVNAIEGVPSGIVNMGINMTFGVAKSILPSKFYLRIDMGLEGDVEPTFGINNMDSKDMDRLYKLLDIAKVKIESDNDKGFKEQLNDLFVGEGSAINKTLKDLKLGEFVSEGGIDCNLYQLIIDAAKLNYKKDENGDSVLKDPSECIEAIDVLQTMKIVLDDENEEYLQSLKSNEHTYKNVKFKTNANGSLDFSSGAPVIENAAPEYYTAEVKPELLDAYEKLIISEFSKEYGLKSEYTVKQIVDNFSDSFDKNEAVQMFDAQKVKEIIGKESVAGVVLDDKMLAALFMKVTEGEQFRDFINVEFVYVEDVAYEGKTHQIMHIGLDSDVGTLAGELTKNETVSKVIRNIMPERFVAEAAFDVTLGADEYKPIEILVYDKTIDSINKIVLSFGAFKDENGKALSLNEYFDKQLGNLRDIIDNMSETLPGLKISASGLALPDVYVALGKMINGSKGESDENYISPDMIESSLKLLTYEGIFNEGKYAFFADDNAVNEFNAQSDNALLKEIKDKYGIADANEEGESYTLPEILHVLNVIDLKNPGKVEGLEVYDLLDSEKFSSLACKEDNWQESLKAHILNVPPVENESGFDMFTSLIKQIISVGDINYGLLGDFDINDLLFAQLNKENDKQYLTLNVRAVIKELLPDGEKDEVRKFVEQLLPSSPSLIQVRIDITTSASTENAIFINDDAQASDSLFTMLENLGMEIDLSEMCNTVRTEFFKLKEQNIDFELGDRSLDLPNVFDMIDGTILETGYDDSGANVKSAFEGIFRTSETRIEKFESDTVVNPISKTSMPQEELVSKIFAEGISDGEFGAYIKDSIETKVGTLLELDFLTATQASQKQIGDRQKLNDLGYDVTSGKVYMVLTVKVDLSKLNSEGEADKLPANLEKLLPKQMLTTFVLEFDETSDQFIYNSFIINGMSKNTSDVLINIMGINGAVQNLEALASDCVSPVNNLLDTISNGVNVEHVFTEDTSASSVRGKYSCRVRI